MTVMIDLPALLAHAQLVYNDHTEDNVETFLHYVNNLEQPDNELEGAILEVVCDLTMHEYEGLA
jgi:hypothetical protein